MTDSAVLDTVLGLIFLCYALALLCSGLVEMIANWVKKRAKYLLRGIRDLLDDMPAKNRTGGGREAEGVGAEHSRNCLSQQHGRKAAIRRDAPRTRPHAATRAGDGGASRRRLDRPAAGAAGASGQDHLERCHGPCIGSAFSARDIIGQADPESVVPSLQCFLADSRRSTDPGFNRTGVCRHRTGRHGRSGVRPSCSSRSAAL